MTLLLACPEEEPELEFIDDSNVIELKVRREKVMVEEEVELEEIVDEPAARAQRTVEKVKQVKASGQSFADQLQNWKQRQQL